ncbi:MAG: hypothetical protein AMJ90_04520 [candidate division Zixibacteria bacterium SM23_73_2]|nr:MAG: hypothetical protein AMJ90_04520 [candidate division Zixibacteria bacterium SM23_73_2]
MSIFHKESIIQIKSSYLRQTKLFPFGFLLLTKNMRLQSQSASFDYFKIEIKGFYSISIPQNAD